MSRRYRVHPASALTFYLGAGGAFYVALAWSMWPLALIGVIFLAIAAWTVIFSWVEVGPGAVIVHQGMAAIVSSSRRIESEDISTVEVVRGPVGALFDYGTLRLVTHGDRIEIDGVKAPESARNAIVEMKS